MCKETQQIADKPMTKSDKHLYILVWVIVIGFFVLVAMTMFVNIQDSTGAVFMLIGAMAAGFGSVIQYFFDSSKGSDDKTKYMTGINKDEPR